MSKIDFKKQKIPFTQVANDVLNDSRLSLKAKGLYSYLYSKPDGWDFETTRMAKDSTDGRDSIRSAVKELEEAGYLKRYKLPNGRMVYKVVFPPMTENPSQAENPMTEKPNDGKTHSGKIRHISNKEKKVIKSINNKDSEHSSQDKKFSQLGAEIINEFSKWNPSCKKFYNNKTQRAACDRLIENYGFDEVMKRIPHLPQTNKMEFVPNITTPLQLEDKWVSLHNQLEQEKNKVNKYKVAFI